MTGLRKRTRNTSGILRLRIRPDIPFIGAKQSGMGAELGRKSSRSSPRRPSSTWRRGTRRRSLPGPAGGPGWSVGGQRAAVPSVSSSLLHLPPWRQPRRVRA
jgi:hypothetical protein